MVQNKRVFFCAPEWLFAGTWLRKIASLKMSLNEFAVAAAAHQLEGRKSSCHVFLPCYSLRRKDQLQNMR